MAVKIITDSASDLPKDIIKELDIDVMPLMVYLNDVEYQDGVGIEYHDFFQAMREGASTRTSQVPNQCFEDTFKKYGNCDEVLYIAFSSGLSGTYQGSVLVKSTIQEENPKFNLTIIDSKSASTGFGLIVYYAAKLAKEGASLEEIINKTKENIEHMEHIFTVDDLEYLYRGGRVSRGAAVLGSMLNIKPILDVEDGKLIPLQKVRSRKKSINRLVEIMGERGKRLDDQVIGICHGDDLEAAEMLKKLIEERYGAKEFIISYTGCAVGAHSGPGTLSVFFLNQ